ncbi:MULTISPECIES: hypothetical protein [Bacteria]|uniref:hypothetical protein n=1 Tax=Bacteria TaxID=2 RepID=UPI003C7ECBC1
MGHRRADGAFLPVTTEGATTTALAAEPPRRTRTLHEAKAQPTAIGRVVVPPRAATTGGADRRAGAHGETDSLLAMRMSAVNGAMSVAVRREACSAVTVTTRAIERAASPAGRSAAARMVALTASTDSATPAPATERSAHDVVMRVRSTAVAVRVRRAGTIRAAIGGRACRAGTSRIAAGRRARGARAERIGALPTRVGDRVVTRSRGTDLGTRSSLRRSRRVTFTRQRATS